MLIKEGSVITALLTGEIDTLIHQVNTQGVMGRGLAKTIRSTWPVHYLDYVSAVLSSREAGDCLLGGWISSEVSPEEKVVGIFAQSSYKGRGKCHTNYTAFREALLSYTSEHRDEVIGLPMYIGCGLGGGDWDVIKGIMLEVENLCGVEFTVYQWEDTE